MANIIIIDDEMHCVNVLKNLITKVHPDYKITGTFCNSIQGLEYLQNHSTDLLFLDIEMPNLNGLPYWTKSCPLTLILFLRRHMTNMP